MIPIIMINGSLRTDRTRCPRNTRRYQAFKGDFVRSALCELPLRSLMIPPLSATQFPPSPGGTATLENSHSPSLKHPACQDGHAENFRFPAFPEGAAVFWMFKNVPSSGFRSNLCRSRNGQPYRRRWVQGWWDSPVNEYSDGELTRPKRQSRLRSGGSVHRECSNRRSHPPRLTTQNTSPYFPVARPPRRPRADK